MSYVGFVNYNSGGNKPIAHTLYGSCATAAATAAKTVTLADFDKLLDGVTIKIKFTYANTAASPTLNINSTGAKAIQKASGTAVAAADSWKAGQVVSFTYDNTAGAWIMNDFRDYASTSAPGIVKLESTPTFNLTAKGNGGSTSNVVTTSGLYAAYDNLLGAIGTETLNSGFGSNVSIKAAINSLYTTCSGALNRLSELESRQYLMVKSQTCITSGSKISSLDYYTVNTYDNYSFCGIVGYWCVTSTKVSIFNLYLADLTHVCVGWKTTDGSAINDNTINVYALYVYQSS